MLPMPRRNENCFKHDSQKLRVFLHKPMEFLVVRRSRRFRCQEPLKDILAYMIEGQYLDEQDPDYYLDFIEHFRLSVYDKFSESKKQDFSLRLKITLDEILKGENVDYNKIFYAEAKHGFNTQDEAKEIFQLIWNTFFGESKEVI
jgi:hypothetical protein